MNENLAYIPYKFHVSLKFNLSLSYRFLGMPKDETNLLSVLQCKKIIKKE